MTEPRALFNGILADHAAAQAAVAPKAPDMWSYRGWRIDCDPKPIPCRDFDWTATHPNYDASWEGEEDGWQDNGMKVNAATYEELLVEIDQWEAIAEEDAAEEAANNGQFGVGA